jgi:hypothetical protein
MRRKKTVISIVFITLFLAIFQWIAPLLVEKKQDEFSPDKIADCSIEESLPIFPLPDLSHILNQPFRYLGHGEETVAFESADGKFVLKLFLQKSMRSKKSFFIPKPSHWIPFYRTAKVKRRRELRKQVLLISMKNYADAFDRMQSETGSIALHLRYTENLLPTVSLIDQKEKKHRIKLDRVPFVLQQKALLVKEKLAQVHTIEERIQIYQALEAFFVQRAEKGFSDLRKTCTLETNFGFIDDRAIQFDVGGVCYSENLRQSPESEVARIKTFLKLWAEVNLNEPFNAAISF